MQIVWSKERDRSTETPGADGWLGRVVSLIQRVGRSGREERSQMRLLETLQLGGKRQLMLVSCAGHQYLVGGGADSIEVIVRAETGPKLANQQEGHGL